MNKETRQLMRMPLNVPGILDKADKIDGLTTFDADIRGAGYIIEDSRLMIITKRNGYIILKRDDISTLQSNLEWLKEEMDRRSRD